MSTTRIEWAAETWNPVRGCSRVSAGCENCYAESMAHRFSGPGQPYEGLTRKTERGPRWTGEVRLIPKTLAEPLRWRKPRMVFVNSMSDLFHESLSSEDIAAVFGVMAATPHITYLVLTKRPERMREWSEWITRTDWSGGEPEIACLALAEASGLLVPRARVEHIWPLPNVWLGVSVESQKYLWRLDHLRRTAARVRFVSLEPLLEDLGGLDLNAIHWVIVGGESGRDARPCHLDHIRAIVKQCEEAAIPCFVKQLGRSPHATAPRRDKWPWPDHVALERADRDGCPHIFRASLRHPKGGDPSEWPEDLRVRGTP